MCIHSVANQEPPQIDVTDGVKHCHDNSHAQETREREKKVARKRLYVASVICLLFMIGEILGESQCFLTVLKCALHDPVSSHVPLSSFTHSKHVYETTVCLQEGTLQAVLQ